MRYMLTAVRINFSQQWKKDTILLMTDWELKFGEYAIMAELYHIYTIEVSQI